MKHDVIIVGGGMAGLTAAAFLRKAGVDALLLEKEKKIGGLVSSFERGGFVFDGGIRAIEDSGIVVPMMRQLGIAVEFLDNSVSIGLARDVIKVSSKKSLSEYGELLRRHFPGNATEIAAIVGEIAKIMNYMDVLYGIDNPLFMDRINDPKYLLETILPWLLKYIGTLPKLAGLKMPVDEYLSRFTKNRALMDMVAQHFFAKTPAYFALSYFSLYLDYRYPKGGTGALPGTLEKYILDKGGEIVKEAEVVRVDPMEHALSDSRGNRYAYDKLLWAADARTLYRILDLGSMREGRTKKRIEAKAAVVAEKKGGDSVFTLYISLDRRKTIHDAMGGAHFFYTPIVTGLSALDLDSLRDVGSGEGARAFTDDKEALFAWIGRYLELTTYEISCPAFRDPTLAPEGKTGLIISTLMDYSLVRHLRELGLYEAMREFCAKRIVEVLEAAIFTGLAASIIDSFTSTPLTIEKTSGNSEGAITGWAFTNDGIPAVKSMPLVARSVLTPIPDVYQAGQWSYSPSGLPIAILTGKLAADRISGELKG